MPNTHEVVRAFPTGGRTLAPGEKLDGSTLANLDILVEQKLLRPILGVGDEMRERLEHLEARVDRLDEKLRAKGQRGAGSIAALVVSALLALALFVGPAFAQTNTPVDTATPTPTFTHTPTKTRTPGGRGNLLTDGVGIVGNLATANGGVMVQAKRQAVSWADDSAIELFTLPAGAVVLDVLVDVTTGFNDSGTDLLDIGITGTANLFVNDLDVATTGRKAPTKTSLGVSVGSSAVAVTATYIPQNANATAGAAVVTLLYLVP